MADTSSSSSSYLVSAPPRPTTYKDCPTRHMTLTQTRDEGKLLPTVGEKKLEE